MNHGVPNQSKANHFRASNLQQTGAGDIRRSPQNFTSQIVNPSFGATNPAKFVNGHFSYSQQQLGNSHGSIHAPARVHNIPIQVSSRVVQQQNFYRSGTPPSTTQYMSTSNKSPSSAMSYYPSGKEQPVREFQSRIPMARQYFGNMSLTNRNRIEESVNHFRRGSAPGSAEYDGHPEEEYLPMSYNLRQIIPDRKESQLVASYYHPPPQNNRSSSSYSRIEPNQLPRSPSRQIHQEKEHEAIREQEKSPKNITSSTHTDAQAMHTVRDHQVVAETDILCSSSSDEEDDVVRGCAQEGDLHLHLGANRGCFFS